MNALLQQLEVAKHLEDEGMMALISSQLFYLRTWHQDMPKQVEPISTLPVSKGPREALLKQFGVKKEK
jgi:hypothetical protein